jgi:hypothetical protein
VAIAADADALAVTASADIIAAAAAGVWLGATALLPTLNALTAVFCFKIAWIEALSRCAGSGAAAGCRPEET